MSLTPYPQEGTRRFGAINWLGGGAPSVTEGAR